jgi:glutaredoxin
MKKFLTIIIINSLILFNGCIDKDNEFSDKKLIEIAKCLTQKGVTMYGAVWCSHCKRQKDRFKDAFQYINYIECDPHTNPEQAKICLDKKIEGVPSWEFPDGSIERGEKEVQELAEKAGCM